MSVIIHWFAVHFGVDHTAGNNVYYNFWSGFGSDLGEVTILGAIVMAFRHHNCHARGCWRLGRHEVDGTPHKTCRKHHPTLSDTAPTVEEIHADHARSIEK